MYESLWGNTAAIARAVAEGLGDDARALHTDEATADALAGIELIVAGAPLLGFSLPTEQMLAAQGDAMPAPPKPADISHPSMRSWLAALPAGKGRSAAFETRIWWSPGSAAKTILTGLEAAGYAAIERERFMVTGRYGPLKDGEIERARAWGAKLASAR
ncbi:MAG: flavodoxin family protein [Coriobacteriia bacterium]|nr:flavodoxin family protein [Coriobacteriia bacterium]